MAQDARNSSSTEDFDPKCEFCQIVAGLAEASVVWQNEYAMAFFPMSPAVPGHTLVIPKVHRRDYWSISIQLAHKLSDGTALIGEAIKSALQPDGMNLITSSGAAAGQTVFHLHLHLVPRWHGDRVGNIWPPARELAVEIEEDLVHTLRQAVQVIGEKQ